MSLEPIDREDNDTDPPPSELERVHSKVDTLIAEERGTRLWQKRIEGVLKDQTDRLDRVEGGIFQLLAITKDIGGGMREAVATAQRAERIAKAADTKSERGSWTDDLAREAATAHVKNLSEEERLAIVAKAKSRATRGKIVYAFAVALIGAFSGALTHLLMR
jgi:hypothetical protein